MPRPLPRSVIHVLRLSYWSHIEARIALDAVTEAGLTIAEFARTYHVSAQRLYAWQRRFAVSAPPSRATDEPLRFVELPAPTHAHTTSSRYEIQFPSGEVLRVEGTVDVTDLGALLMLLRGGVRTC
jgi:transposase-like protein